MMYRSRKKYIFTILAVIALTAFVEWQMGRLWFCKCGIVSLWSGDIWSNQNSQQFSDPYIFTHVIHGAVFYFFTWLVLRNRPPWTRLLIAVFLESGWEILENHDFIINRYRESTISLDYYGDSILNSIADIGAMIAGFILSWKLPWKATLFWVILIEIFLVFWIKDSLAINIIMLIYPIEALKTWQMP